MMNVTYKERAGVLSLMLEGHAGAAEYGHDLVCASASILAYTLAAGIANADERGILRTEPILALSPGDARIVCVPFPEAYGEVHAMYELILGGIRLLSSQYPANVKFIFDAMPERA